MAFDGFFTRSMVTELKKSLVGGRINKIYQPYEQELHLVIRSQRHNYRLVASIHPQYYRCHLSQDKAANPNQAPMFCMMLRKHLESAVVLAIRQVDNDRIIEMELSGRNDLGDLREFRLIFELMGKHSNILLVDSRQGTLLDCIKHVSPAFNSYRMLQPGATYIRPPLQQDQVNLFALTDSQLTHFATEHGSALAQGQGHRLIQGMGKDLAQFIAFQMALPDHPLVGILKALILTASHPHPTLIDTGDRVYFHALDLRHLPGDHQAFPTLSQLVEEVYGQKVQRDRLRQLTGNLIQRLSQIMKRDREKMVKLDREKALAQDSDTYRIYGELLSAFANQVTKGLSEAVVPNYYNNNQNLTIPLDPAKSPIENSQTYFKRYGKYRDSLKHVDYQRQQTQAEIDYLDGILLQLDQADPADIEAIKEELHQEGYLKAKKSSVKKRAKTQSRPRRYQSSEGIPIYVGRNNQQNDDLSLKQAAKHHWWLHAKNIPGAHVIVASDNPAPTTLQEAAQIAAYYSKSQQSANVPVDIVQVKQLHKPNGARPGFVIYQGQKTLYVTPDPQAIQALSVEEP